jgi:hypothetical protein
MIRIVLMRMAFFGITLFSAKTVIWVYGQQATMLLQPGCAALSPCKQYLNAAH